MSEWIYIKDSIERRDSGDAVNSSSSTSYLTIASDLSSDDTVVVTSRSSWDTVRSSTYSSDGSVIITTRSSLETPSLHCRSLAISEFAPALSHVDSLDLPRSKLKRLQSKLRRGWTRVFPTKPPGERALDEVVTLIRRFGREMKDVAEFKAAVRRRWFAEMEEEQKRRQEAKMSHRAKSRFVKVL